MKAWVLHGIGDIRYEEVNRPEPAEQEVLVAVKAVGICGSDIPRIYQNGAHRMPLIPGHEFSGEVVKLGAGLPDSWLGKRVGIFPLIPCCKCIPCQTGKYEMCRQYSYLGSRCDGGFAEYVSVPVWNLIELPQNVSYEEAAMLEPMAVAVHAMRRVALHTTDIAAIWGLGTIGLLLMMFLIERGVQKVLVIGNKTAQKQRAAVLGLPEEWYCDSTSQDVKEWLMCHTKGHGADVFFECVGKNDTVSRSIDLAAPAGKVCMVGNPYSDIRLKKDVYWKILRNQLTITGTWNSSYTGEITDDWHYVLDKLAQGKISPASLISHRLQLDNLEHGLTLMRDKSEDYIKVMVTGL